MKTSQKPPMAGAGFTLIELLVTLALIGLLASVAVPMVDVTTQRSREQELRETLRTLRTAIDAYKQAVDDGLIAPLADASGYPPSLEILVAGVPNQRDPQGALLRFLRKLPRDPLNRNPELTPAQTWGKRSYASPHEAPMEGRDVFDVYSLEAGIGLNGVPYKEW